LSADESLGAILAQFQSRLQDIDEAIRHIPDDCVCSDCNRILPGRPDVDWIIENRPDIRGPVPRCVCTQNRIDAADRLDKMANLPRSVRGTRGPNDWTAATMANIIDTAGNADAVHLMRAYVEGNSPPVAILIGPPGTGKTHMLEAVGRAFLERSQSVRYVLVSSMLDSLRPSGPEDPQADISEYILPHLLVLDDLGVEKASEWVIEKLMAVIDDRYRNNRKLLIATNASEVEIIQRLGSRIADRLYDENSGKVARAIITGDSARQSAMFAPVEEEEYGDH
jgi:DNA replication protein DnaC